MHAYRKGQNQTCAPQPNSAGRVMKALIWAFSLAPLAVCLILWRILPEQLPMQFGLDGIVSRMGTKTEFLVMCAFGPALAVLLAIVPRVDPHRDNYLKFAKAYAVMRLCFALVYLGAVCLVLTAAFFPEPFSRMQLSRLVITAVGLLFCVIGNFMPKFHHNYFCGIRTPWALADENNWRQTHRFAGPLWFFGGLCVAVLSFVLPARALHAATGVVLAVIVVVPLGYSYILYKKVHANKRGS